GARMTWRMRSGEDASVKRGRSLSSEEALVDVDHVARLEGIVARRFHLVDDAVRTARDAEAAHARALGIAARDGDGRLDRHAGDEGILAGGLDLAVDEEWPVLEDVDRD